MHTDPNPNTKIGLSKLALDAAIELELVNGNLDCLPSLTQFVSAIRKQLTEYNGSFFLKNTALYDVYYHALSNADRSVTSDRQSILEKLQLVIEHSKDVDNNEKLDNMKQFCLDVHEAIANDLMEEHEIMVSRNAH